MLQELIISAVQFDGTSKMKLKLSLVPFGFLALNDSSFQQKLPSLPELQHLWSPCFGWQPGENQLPAILLSTGVMSHCTGRCWPTLAFQERELQQSYNCVCHILYEMMWNHKQMYVNFCLNFCWKNNTYSVKRVFTFRVLIFAGSFIQLPTIADVLELRAWSRIPLYFSEDSIYT